MDSNGESPVVGENPWEGFLLGPDSKNRRVRYLAKKAELDLAQLFY